MSNKLKLMFLSALVFSLSCTFIPWLITFRDAQWSTSPADWGVFGDYVGGVLSVLLSAFGLAALIYTLKIQSDAIEIQNEAIKAQLSGIQSGKESRDDEVYNKQSIECLNEAYNKLINTENGRLLRDRINWLESARLLITAQNLSSWIASKSVNETYRAAEKVIKSRFSNLLNPENSPETKLSNYFTEVDWERSMEGSSDWDLDRASVFVIYRFASWQDSEPDEIDEIKAVMKAELINK